MRKVYQNQKAEADWAQVKWKKNVLLLTV